MRERIETTSSSQRALEIVEPGGRGGVYQHVLGNLQQGTYVGYERVVVHTARDCELAPELPGVRYCKCMRYQRRGPKTVRTLGNLLWALLGLTPHIFAKAATRQQSDWEVQGLFGSGIFFLIISSLRLLRRTVVFVPHNTFSRSASALERVALRRSLHIATECVYFVDAELPSFKTSRKATKRQLWQYQPSIDQQLLDAWRANLNCGTRPIVSMIGQLRMDKNPVLLLEACQLIEAPILVLFAGEDKGAAAEIAIRSSGSRHQLEIIDRYLSLEDLVAIIQISSVIVCPYAVASQSAVIALASQNGTPVVASARGGLVEQAQAFFELDKEDSSQQLAEGIWNALQHR